MHTLQIIAEDSHQASIWVFMLICNLLTAGPRGFVYYWQHLTVIALWLAALKFSVCPDMQNVQYIVFIRSWCCRFPSKWMSPSNSSCLPQKRAAKNQTVAARSYQRNMVRICTFPLPQIWSYVVQIRRGSEWGVGGGGGGREGERGIWRAATTNLYLTVQMITLLFVVAFDLTYPLITVITAM